MSTPQIKTSKKFLRFLKELFSKSSLSRPPQRSKYSQCASNRLRPAGGLELSKPSRRSVRALIIHLYKNPNIIFAKTVYKLMKMWYNKSAKQENFTFSELNMVEVYILSMIKMYALFSYTLAIWFRYMFSCFAAKGATFFVRGFGCALFI